MLLSRYLLRQAAWPTLLLTLLGCLLFWGLQALRLGHHIVGAGIGVSGVMALFALSLPALLVFVLPLAVAAGLALTLARLAPELDAMRACGASPARLARGPALLVLLVAATAACLGGGVEHASRAALYRRLAQAVARGVLGKTEPGQFSRIGELTLLYETGERRVDGLHVTRLFVARGDDVLLAARGVLRVVDGPLGVELSLRDGELHLARRGARYERLRFGRWTQRVELPVSGQADFAFVRPTGPALQRAGAAGLLTLALGVLALVCGLLLRPPRAGWSTLALIAAHEVARWALSASPTLVIAAPALSAITALGAWIALQRFGR